MIMLVKVLINFRVTSFKMPNWFRNINERERERERERDFVFDSVQLLFYECRKKNFKRGGWFIY